MHRTGGDLEVLESLLAWSRHLGRAWLCTITRTVGSSPRPPGSMMACSGAGNVMGSLSGGCVEEDLIAELIARPKDADPAPILREYGVTAEENERLGLPCGGRLEVLVETYGSDEAQTGILASLCERLAARDAVRRIVALDSGALTD